MFLYCYNLCYFFVVEIEILGIVAVAEKHQKLRVAQDGKLFGRAEIVLLIELSAKLLVVFLETGAKLFHESGHEAAPRSTMISDSGRAT